MNAKNTLVKTTRLSIGIPIFLIGYPIFVLGALISAIGFEICGFEKE